MSKHLFTGFASNYSAKQIFRHTFASGSIKHSEALVSTLKKHYHANQALLYATGRAALAAAIKATIPAGSKIAIPGLTCYAVHQAVLSADCIPIYLDISVTNYNSSTKEFLRTLSRHPDINAVIVQNTLGLTINIAELEKIASKRKIVIIEDLAHCAGAHYSDGREVGTVGDAIALSFGKGKSIDTVRGGACLLHAKPLRPLLTPIELSKLSDRLRDRFYPLLGSKIRFLHHIKLGSAFSAFLFKFRFISRSADGPVELNKRLTHWQSALALRQFQNLPKTAKLRATNAAKIIATLSLPPIPKGSAPLRVPILTPDPDTTLATLTKHHVHFDDIWYDTPVSPYRYYKQVKFPESICPNSVAISEHLLNIPTHYPAVKLTPALKILEKSLS